MGLNTSKTKEGKCPECGGNVEYDGTLNIDCWPNTIHHCECPKCNWSGDEVGIATFVEMQTDPPTKTLGKV